MRISAPIAATAALLAVLAPAPAGAVTVSAADCARMVQHTASADVAYKPGVDVNGNSVAPADLNGGSALVAVPEEIEIPITVELDERYGMGGSSNLYKPEAKMGKVVYKDGKAWYNGQPLQSNSQSALAAACRQRLNGSR